MGQRCHPSRDARQDHCPHRGTRHPGKIRVRVAVRVRPPHREREARRVGTGGQGRAPYHEKPRPRAGSQARGQRVISRGVIWGRVVHKSSALPHERVNLLSPRPRSASFKIADRSSGAGLDHRRIHSGNSTPLDLAI